MNPKLKEAYKPPFYCDDKTATVEDQNGNVIITVRGWSRLCDLYNHDDAFQFQLDIAHWIADRLNELDTTKTELTRHYI